MNHRMLRAAWLAAAALLVPGTALAQETGLPTLPPLIVTVNPDKTMVGVDQRYRPDYAPVGLRAGSFNIFPSIGAGLGYESNIFATDTNEQSDAFYIVQPAVVARSDWSRHQLDLRAQANLQDFFSTPNSAQNSYEVGADGRFDLAGQSRIEAGGEFAREIERRDSSAFPEGVVAPVAYTIANGYVRGIYDTGRSRLIGSADVTRFNFMSTEAVATDGSGLSIPLDQDYRDRTVARVSGRGDLAISSTGTVYLLGTYETIDYDTATISTTDLPNRDGQEWQALIGTEWNYSLLHADIAAGYLRHSYDNDAYPPIDGLTFNADVQYLATPLLTLSAIASRTVEETSVASSSGFFSTRGVLRADYELLRNLILNANVSYRFNDFARVPRKDKVFRLGAGARYLVNRRLRFEGDAYYSKRNVENAAYVPDFDDFQVSVRTVFQF